jgi:hypothetical protein
MLYLQPVAKLLRSAITVKKIGSEELKTLITASQAVSKCKEKRKRKWGRQDLNREALLRNTLARYYSNLP